jgi:hypothetical protein
MPGRLVVLIGFASYFSSFAHDGCMKMQSLLPTWNATHCVGTKIATSHVQHNVDGKYNTTPMHHTCADDVYAMHEDMQRVQQHYS